MGKHRDIAALIPLLALTGCMQGPAFLKQNAASDAALHPVSVSTTTQQDGGISGLVSAASKQPQTISAPSASSISGTKVTFPPGSLAVDTQITIGPGTTIATNSVAQQLNIASTVQSAGQPVIVQSSVALDAASPFTLAIPLPSGAGLALSGDPYANLSVFFHINKQQNNGADYTGVIPRSELVVKNDTVSFTVLFFGTYQAAFTATPVTLASEVAAVPQVLPPSKEPHFYYVQGPATTSFGPPGSDLGQSYDNFQGWFHVYSPIRVADSVSGNTLSVGIKAKLKPSNTN